MATTLNQCEFKYAKFHRTLLEPKEMIATLPPQPNLRRDILQNLRVNAVETGDYEGQRNFVLEEIKAKKDHLSRAFRGADHYYKEKYNTVLDKAIAGVRWLSLHFSGFLWGHGERPFMIITSVVVLMSILTAINFWSVLGRESLADTQWGLEVLRYCFETFLDASPDIKFSGFLWVDYALIIMRYLYISLFISVLFKWVSHR